MRKTEERTISGKTFRITQMGFQTGQKVFLRVGKLVAPFLAAAAGKAAKSEADVAAALAESVGNITEADLAFFVESFACCNELVDGERVRRLDSPGIQDELFAGDYGLFLGWIKENLAVNFSSFFSETLAKLGSKEPEGSASPVQLG